MNVKKILKQLRKPDDYTDKTISEEYPADWNVDEIFEKSFENYMMQKETEENPEKYETLCITEERKINRYSGMLQALIPVAACMAIIIVLGRFSTEHKPDDEITPLVSVTETAVVTETQKETQHAVTDVYTTVKNITESTVTDAPEYVTVSNEISDVRDDYEKTFAVQNTDPSNIGTEELHDYSDTVKHEDEVPEKTEPVITDIPEVTEITAVTENADENMRILTMEELFVLSEKGDELDWSDFKEFRSEKIVSDLYTEKYVIEGDIYYLIIGGVPEEKPDYIRLYSEFVDDIPLEIDSQEFIQFRELYRFFGS